MTDRILVVDDEPDIAALVAYSLTRAKYRVSTASCGREALAAAAQEQPDLVVLDVMLPDMSGYDVLNELRARPRTSDVGVILLTARTREGDRVHGLSLGADDYLLKPFSPQELVLRVGAVLRRLKAKPLTSGSVMTLGPLEIDTAAHRVSVAGTEVALTATEYRLLTVLAERVGRVQSRDRLLEDVWNAHPEIQTRQVDMHIQRLRAKLGPAAHMIETVRGFGYRFREPRSDNSFHRRGSTS